MNKTKIIFLLLGLIVLGIAAFFLMRTSDRSMQKEGLVEEKKLRVKTASTEKGGMRISERKKNKRDRITENKKGIKTKDVKSVNQSRAHDKIKENLSETQQRLLESIREASDNEEKSEVIRIVQNMVKSKGWPSAFPKEIREEAIEALSWIGKDCLPEAVHFLSDPDEDVARSAIQMFEDVVSDTDLDDTERADVLVSASKVLTDPDSIDSMLYELNSVKNSVAVDTIKRLWESANETALKLLPDVVEFLTGEDNIDTPEKLDAWLRENPDDEE